MKHVRSTRVNSKIQKKIPVVDLDRLYLNIFVQGNQKCFLPTLHMLADIEYSPSLKGFFLHPDLIFMMPFQGKRMNFYLKIGHDKL